MQGAGILTRISDLRLSVQGSPFAVQGFNLQVAVAHTVSEISSHTKCFQRRFA